MLEFHAVRFNSKELTKCFHHKIRFQILYTSCCHFQVNRIASQFPCIDQWFNVSFLLASFCLLYDSDLRLFHKF